MSNYTIVTNFLAKDSLISGNPLKLVKGADFTTEFTAVQTALNTKFDGAVQFAPDGTAGQPSFGFTNNAGVGMYNAAGVLGFATAATQRGTVSTAGNWTINAPTSGVALAVTGLSGSSALTLTPSGATDNALTILAPAASNSSISLQIAAASQGVIGVAGATGQLISGSALNDVCVRSVNGAIRFSGAASSSAQALLDTTGNFNVANGTGTIVGPVYAGIPVNTQNATYTLVLGDANKCIHKSGGGAHTDTIPANATVAFPVGTALTFTVINGAASCTIAVLTDTLVWAPSGTTGNRVLAGGGVATLIKVAATTWMISGVGLT
jgi:hypothetical protein